MTEDETGWRKGVPAAAAATRTPTWHNGTGLVDASRATRAEAYRAEIAAVNAAVGRRGMADPVLVSFAKDFPAYRLSFVRADGTCEFQDPDADVYPGHPDWTPQQDHAAALVRADVEVPCAADDPFWQTVLAAAGIPPHPRR